jgi:hypothetical protein
MGPQVGRVFHEPWEETGELDDPWTHGVLIGGMASPSDRLGLAHDYAQAAANLVDAALVSGEPWRLCFPFFYLYRHALELYLKNALPQSSSRVTIWVRSSVSLRSSCARSLVAPCPLKCGTTCSLWRRWIQTVKVFGTPTPLTLQPHLGVDR